MAGSISYNITCIRSEGMARGLAFNSTSAGFTKMDLQTADPVSVASIGALDVAVGGLPYTASGIKILPCADTGVGTPFSMRVYGWDVQTVPSGDPLLQVWFPVFLAEFACTTGDLPGPLGNETGGKAFAVRNNMYFCDTIMLVQGGLGDGGVINSTGPGTNLLAYAQLDINGSKRISFDFQAADSSSGISMNCRWSKR